MLIFSLSGLMIRVSAKQDYSGPDCRFLTFKTGDEINVYYKLTGRREDLWQGSKGKAYGFFPKDTVTIEEVYISEEIEIPAKEIDFVCLDGGEYFFENEDSILHSINENREDPMEHSLREEKSAGGRHPTEESPHVINQETPEPETPEKESWTSSGIAGWFGMGKTNEKKDPETDSENINIETINEEAESQNQLNEEAPPEKSSWLGGRLKKFLPFGQQKDEPQVKDNEGYGEKVSTATQEQRNINKDGEDSKDKWFNYEIRDVLGLGTKNEKQEELKLNVEGIDNEMTPENLSQNKAMDNRMPGQSEKSKVADDSREHIAKDMDVNEYSDTLSQGTDIIGLVHEVSSVVDEHARDEVHKEVVSLFPDDLQPGADFYGCSWDVVIFTALFGFLSVLLFTCRTMRCIKSRFYAGRESKLGNQVAEVLSSKREVLEKLSLVQKQYEDVQQKFQESGHQKLLTEISDQKALQESLQASNKELEENIAKVERDLEEEKQRGSELDNTVTYVLAELNEKIKALEETIKKENSQKEETRTTQKVFEINKGRLEASVQDEAEEKSHLEESIKQLSREAEGWEERFNELSENSRIVNSSVGVMQEDLSSKQNQIKLNASLKSVESEKKHLCDNLSDEMKAKEQLAECITNLQNTSQSLSHEKGQLEEEVEKLKQKMNVMMEVYQENERKLHRKLTVQEKERIQKEAKLSKADEKMNLAATELVTVKTRVSELEEEMDKTVSSYQNQVTSYEKKSHDNWLTARAAERYLSDVKKETAHLRQKLTEAEYKLELLEKDPFALDVMQAIGRENSPFGISPISRHPEGRAFLSPPTLLEGPLRLSPMLPAADRGVRPPGYYPGYPGPKERVDVNSDRRADHQRTLSDAGSLSPPWDREQRNNVPPPGLPYPEPPFAPRRAERFYHYLPPSGRFSGPAELTRNQGKPFMDSQGKVVFSAG
ncbi:hypothetical protein GDO78_010857 [Eleutherodactylus coqui]|uniref:SH3 domain-containing protein n=1 Tax=Eleutherodactylus coqui TaxID=57060 RepID=A0A8J6K7V8_ELECQ|nr:hypothetical protein GDO78_010857 [Eleutherodactylus coqui]